MLAREEQNPAKMPIAVTLGPADAGYKELLERQLLSARNRFRLDWEGISEAYNAAPVDSMICIDSEKVKRLSNLIKVIERRKVTRGVDYDISRVKDERGAKVVVIMKLSSKELQS